MKTTYITLTAVLALSTILSSCTQAQTTKKTQTTKPMTNENSTTKVTKTDAEWAKQLTPEQYDVLRNKGTERAFTGKYTDTKDKGIYCCAGCGAELFTDTQKFDSHCGWPSFDEELGKGEKIKKITDYSHGMTRTEIVCAKCDGHLGHLFDDGPSLTKKRYCVNSASLNLIKK
ncbi:MAG: peptide-methionine (R)-S-oxide reductase MsrB [Bacteroidia bacterium]